METASPPTPPEHAPQDGDDAPGPRVIGLVADGKLTNKLAQQVVVAVLDGEGEPEHVEVLLLP